ncbi:MAG: response regulator [bacterium]
MMREKESAEDNVKRRKAKILVVDDDLGIRELLRELLSEEGYPVKMAQNGKEALLKARKESFDLVLTDLRMPEMDGVQLLKELRKITPDIRVIVMTATDDLETAVKMKKFGACDYITKPFHLDKVLQKVRRALGRKNGQTGGAIL